MPRPRNSPFNNLEHLLGSSPTRRLVRRPSQPCLASQAASPGPPCGDHSATSRFTSPLPSGTRHETAASRESVKPHPSLWSPTTSPPHHRAGCAPLVQRGIANGLVGRPRHVPSPPQGRLRTTRAGGYRKRTGGQTPPRPIPTTRQVAHHLCGGIASGQVGRLHRIPSPRIGAPQHLVAK